MITARTDHVGSLLRPPELLQARAELAEGKIDPAQFKAVEDAAIDEVVALQESAGCEVVTDGEFRRISFQSQIADSTEGFGTWDLEAFLWGDWYGDDIEDWHRPRPDDLGVTGTLVRRRHLSAEELTYLRGRTSRVAKVTLPSPSLLANFWSSELSRDFYPTLDDFLIDVTEILRQEVLELERLGYRLLLEYDDERSGDFQPLQHVPDDKMVVLGIVTTKSPKLEASADLERRVREAAKVIDLERLAISPQCGFSTSTVGNDLTSADQAVKLQLLAETAAEIWG